MPFSFPHTHWTTIMQSQEKILTPSTKLIIEQPVTTDMNSKKERHLFKWNTRSVLHFKIRCPGNHLKTTTYCYSSPVMLPISFNRHMKIHYFKKLRMMLLCECTKQNTTLTVFKRNINYLIKLVQNNNNSFFLCYLVLMHHWANK